MKIIKMYCKTIIHRFRKVNKLQEKEMKRTPQANHNKNTISQRERKDLDDSKRKMTHHLQGTPIKLM